MGVWSLTEWSVNSRVLLSREKKWVKTKTAQKMFVDNDIMGCVKE